MDTLFLNIDGVLNNSIWFKSKTKNEKSLAFEEKYKLIVDIYACGGLGEVSISTLLIGEKLCIDNCKALPDLLDSIGNPEIARNHNIDTSLTKNMLLNDPYLNTERYNDVSFGFGGHCLPKDTNHLSEMIDGRENPINIFKSLININRSLIDMHARMITSVYCSHKKTFPEARIVFFKLGFKKDHESIDNSRIFHVMNTTHDYPIDTNICYIHDYDLGISNERITLKDIKENDIIVSEFMYKELEGLSNMIYTAEKIYVGGKENV